MNFNQNIIEKLLIELNIHYNSNRIQRNWMQVICPFHNDKDFGNASINLETGVINCYNCKSKASIIKMYMNYNNLSYKDALDQIFNSTGFYIPPKDFKSIKENKKKELSGVEVKTDDYLTISLNPEEYHYTKIRGYTKEFCEKFNIRACISDWYNDYFLIPIIDSKLNINIVEARKLKQRETIIKIFKNIDFNKFRMSPEQYFDYMKNQEGWKFNKKWQIVNNKNQIINSIYLEYLLKPKVLYPSYGDNTFTIWNIDNLDFNKDLFVTEGSASIPKIYTHISQNCSTLFGSNVSDEQIALLKKFKKVIIIPDNDEASFTMIQILNNKLSNLFIIDIESEDTDENYIQDIQKCSIIEANLYILKKFNKYLK